MRSRRAKVVVIVCIAVFAFTVIAAVPMFALCDALTPIDALFWSPASVPAPSIADIALPSTPAVAVRAPRGPPVT